MMVLEKWIIEHHEQIISQVNARCSMLNDTQRDDIAQEVIVRIMRLKRPPTNIRMMIGRCLIKTMEALEADNQLIEGYYYEEVRPNNLPCIVRNHSPRRPAYRAGSSDDEMPDGLPCSYDAALAVDA